MPGARRSRRPHPRSERRTDMLDIARTALPLAALGALLVPLAAQTERPPESVRPGALVRGVDAFHPERQPQADGTLPALPEPAYGGRAIVHFESTPSNLNPMLEKSAYARRILYELHETLLLRDWSEPTRTVPVLAERYEVEDTLVRKGGRGADHTRIVRGKVREEGSEYVVRTAGAEKEQRFAREEFEALERGTVITFHLRRNVRWHDGHPFDASDVLFSWRLFLNDSVNCDDKRFQYVKILHAECPDPFTIRFYYDKQYFGVLGSIGDLPILPSHLYNLSDPDNVSADPEYHAARKAQDPAWKPDDAEQGDYVNKNPHNRQWVGLGPYRMVAWTNEHLDAERFDGYFDPQHGGYLDTLRWRFIASSSAAFQALLNGELDFFNMLTTDEFFSAELQKPSFTDKFYKGWQETALYWYVGWNMRSPKFQDPRVRRALAQLFDFPEFSRSFYHDLVTQVTGHAPHRSSAYDPGIVPLPYDPTHAVELLTEAGWYDRDGDQILDKDDVPLEIELCIQAGQAAPAAFGARYQESLARVGIRLKLNGLEWNALNERKDKRTFEAIALGWSPPAESDPEQVWHSKWAGAEKSANHVGLADPEVDRLIEAGQRELDFDARQVIWRRLHARIYELQPYLFCYSAPRKFAMKRTLRGFEAVTLDPSYVLRRWYYPKDTPGTRATRGRP
jgi:ABC-type transport system substrate-binding protein